MFTAMKHAKQSLEVNSQLNAEAKALRLIALGGSAHAALHGAEARGDVSPRVLAALKATSITKAAAPSVGTVSGGDVVGPTNFPGFQAALRTSSVFDAVAAEAMTAPFRSRIGMMTTQLTGSKIGEGSAKLGQTLQFGQNLLVPEKLVSLLACTQEFLDGAPEAMESLVTQLRIAVGSAADLEFLTDIAATNSDVATEPMTFDGILTEVVGNLLSAVDHNQASRLFLVVGLGHARHMTIESNRAGIVGMTPQGGVFAGLRTLVSDSLPAGTVSLIDATGLVCAASPVEIRTSDQALIELATTSSMTSATGTGATATSMWQTNSVAILAERSIAFGSLRPNAFASLTSVNWGTASTESPLPG
jgi:hypothetical protein